ncbi:MAG: hypothetical protein BJ554DRAFT_3832 [Olpidium bornovanus]|uniref:Uncharacterized protein n=1 Tax=Olpidium bornovanus TaxID=278681 RepID=A0A8H7ZN40_9FUNG|nr:MAG: hypothetical protein BJ554DRAFT_3832 [Olpidium bornovanus]
MALERQSAAATERSSRAPGDTQDRSDVGGINADTVLRRAEVLALKVHLLNALETVVMHCRSGSVSGGGHCAPRLPDRPARRLAWLELSLSR